MVSTFRLQLNEVEIDRLLTGRDGPVYRYVAAAAAEVFANMHALAPKSTGQLVASIDVSEEIIPGREVRMSVGSDRLRAWWTDQGTGLYGPRHDLIRPKRASHLVFRGKRDGKLLRKKYVRGQHAQDWAFRSLLPLQGRFIVRRNPTPMPPVGSFRA
ncbi:hypothetical protein ACFC1T_09635 [Kitasatospora sp. NPDC056076]|uniref:hypothetical protein n=1 Tax=Kitasatospora sp. NPDC056076 TaxID=3345703 RepID=UPI0035D5C59A